MKAVNLSILQTGVTVTIMSLILFIKNIKKFMHVSSRGGGGGERGSRDGNRMRPPRIWGEVHPLPVIVFAS
jgi:hypothetical protein